MSLRLRIKHQLSDFLLEAEIEVRQGITMLYGASGSGKTSIIKFVAGLMTPDEGYIELNGVTLFDSKRGINIPAHRRHMGMIFQEARLFPHMDVRANLRFGRRHHAGRDAAVVDEERVIEMLGIGHLLARRPQTLSGGEQQRVAIGRALLSGPQMLLADEPLATLR
jgi:ABC-type molybdate transport system, ATPase component